MTPSTTELIARFKQQPDSEFSAEELEQLADASASDVFAAKIAALQYFRAKNFARCIELTERVLERERSEENVVNFVVALRGVKELAKALAVLEKYETVLDRRVFHDLMCSCLARLGQRAEAIRHGDEALRLKDEACASKIAPLPLKLHAFDIEAPKKNVIAFSVFGANTRYLMGALNNATVARYLYPGWTARFIPMNPRRRSSGKI